MIQLHQHDFSIFPIQQYLLEPNIRSVMYKSKCGVKIAGLLVQ